MFSILFSSIGLHICGLIFLLLVTFMFFTGNREKNFASTLFSLLLIFSYLIIISEVGAYFLDTYLPGMRTLITIFSRMFVVSVLGYVDVFCLYVIAKFLIKDLDQNPKKKKNILIIFMIISLIVFIISCFLDIDLQGTNSEGHLYVLTGSYLYAMYPVSALGLLLLLYVLIAKFKELDIIQRILIIYIQLSLISITLLQIILNYDVSDTPYILTIYVVSFYFTIEATDYRALGILKEKQKTAEEKNNIIKSYIDDMSNNAINPLNNIINLANDIKLNNNIDINTLKQNISYISSECVKLSSEINKEGDIKW